MSNRIDLRTLSSHFLDLLRFRTIFNYPRSMIKETFVLMIQEKYTFGFTKRNIRLFKQRERYNDNEMNASNDWNLQWRRISIERWIILENREINGIYIGKKRRNSYRRVRNTTELTELLESFRGQWFSAASGKNSRHTFDYKTRFWRNI